MTRKEALKALLAKVENAAGPDGIESADDFDLILRGAPRKSETAFWPDWTKDAYFGSLNSAKALHEAALPGWRVLAIMECDDKWTVSIEQVRPPTEATAAASDTMLARAWLIAILKALIAEVDE